MNEQVQKVLNDPDGAIQYLLDGDKEHPNRRDLTVTGSHDSATGKANPFSQQATSSAFGKPSAFGATSSPSPFSSNNNNNASPFGQSTQANTSSAFGQASQLGGSTPAFGQASQPGPAATFGQSSQLGNNSPFAQASQTGATSAFGQASQLGGTSAFGQPSSLGGSSAFGQASALGQSKPAFGQSTQPGNAFSSSQPTSAFGQPTQMNQASPFAAAAQAVPATSSPFAGAVQTQSTPFGGGSAFGQTNQSTSSPFGQASQSSSPFAQPAQQQSQNQANTSAVKSPFAPSHGHPPQATASAAGDTATPPLSSYVQQSNGYLQSWRGRPVTYIDNVPYFSKTGNVRDSNSLERIWFPGGPPASNAYAADKEELYQKAGATIEEAYRHCAETGDFHGKVPLLAPIRAWTRYDI